MVLLLLLSNRFLKIRPECLSSAASLSLWMYLPRNSCQRLIPSDTEYVNSRICRNDKILLIADQLDSIIAMKRQTEHNNEFSYHHTRSVIVLIVFTVLMAGVTCFFAYLFDQISGIKKVHTLNQNTRLLTTQSSRSSSSLFIARKI